MEIRATEMINFKMVVYCMFKVGFRKRSGMDMYALHVHASIMKLKFHYQEHESQTHMVLCFSVALGADPS